MQVYEFKSDKSPDDPMSQFNDAIIHIPDRGYLLNNNSDSEPAILYYTQSIDDRLYDVFPYSRILKSISERPNDSDSKTILNDLMKKHKDIGMLLEEDAYTGMRDDIFDKPYIKLEWDKFRLAFTRDNRKAGYFIAHGWSPIYNSLIYSGLDVVYDFNDEELQILNVNSPEGMHVPPDVVLTRSNCGPSALAAYTKNSCEDIIKLYPEFYGKGYLGWKPMLEILDKLGRHHEKQTAKGDSLEESFAGHGKGMARIQWVISYKKDYLGWRCWSEEERQTHWIAYNEGRIFDVNSPTDFGYTGNWTSEDYWRERVVPMIMPPEAKSWRMKMTVVEK